MCTSYKCFIWFQNKFYVHHCTFSKIIENTASYLVLNFEINAYSLLNLCKPKGIWSFSELFCSIVLENVTQSTLLFFSLTWLGVAKFHFNKFDISNGLCNECCVVNTLKPRQNGCHIPVDIFKGIFMNKNIWICIDSSLKFVPKGPINNIPALLQSMDWHLPGSKPLPEPTMVRLLAHICVTQP